MTRPRRVSPRFIWALALIVVFGTVWLVDGREVLEKVIQRLVTPAGLLWIGLGTLAVVARRRRERAGFVGSLALWSVLTVGGNGALMGRLFLTLEREYVQLDPFAELPYDSLIILGGGSAIGANGRPQLNSAGDRLVLAASLFHAGRAQRLICTGHRIAALDPRGVDPSEQSMQILKELGVPPRAIVQSGGTNTSEELRAIVAAKLAWGRIGLVTSAWHMPRALRLARSCGLEVSPVPANFASPRPIARSRLSPGALLLQLVPSAEALESAARLGKELLARLTGR